MKVVALINFFLLLVSSGYSQNATQSVKGTILDKQAETPLIGATVMLVSDVMTLGSVSDLDGNFVIENVPIGRQAFSVEFLGYETVVIPNVEISSGKEVFLNVEMEESLIEINEIVITAATEKDKSINDMATVSSRQFSMEEVNRFSGGRSDVGRLAGNFAGVSTADDSRNDIVIRGNSPTGLLWRLEGIPIPSPNHFGTVGTTGGPVSALNTNMLKNSDFMTSAFPAEYGDALSGVFDIGFRNGNKDETEYTFQLGAVTGIEAMVEGPLSKKNNGSFLIAGRYSFLGIATALGMDIGTNAVPNYYDLSFKLDFGKTKFGNFTLFGIGGRSDIDFLGEEIDASDLFAAEDEDAFADSRFGVIGLKHNLLLNNSSYLRTVIGFSENGVKFSRERYYNLNQSDEFRETFVSVDDGQNRLTLSSYYNKKFNAKTTIRVGTLIEKIGASLNNQSAEFGIDNDQDGVYDLIEVYDNDESAYLSRLFAQVQHRFNEKWTFNAGINAMHYNLNEQFVLEPRLALNWQLAPKHQINLGYGLHNKTQPILIQVTSLVEGSDISYPNRSLGFTRSHQLVLGHDFKINSSWRSKIEVYYQNIDNVPVEKDASSFSVLNVGADFGFPIDKNNLVNDGTGINKGVELTLEKFFTDGYYMLFTGSLFDSKYTGSDGIERNSAFNNQRVMNLLLGKEFKWGKEKQHRISFDTKFTTAGGRFYTPVDLEKSKITEIEEFIEDEAFSLQYDSYLRLDIKFGVKLNSPKKKFSQAFYFDIQNVTNSENIFRKSYNRITNEVNDVFQIGFFPNFMYKVEF